MTPLTLTNRWTGLSNSLRVRSARLVDTQEIAHRIKALLIDHGAPIVYEVFDSSFVLCEPALPGVAGDPDIALVLGEAEHELFFVAQRERGGLSMLSVHEAIHDAVRDFLGRAIGQDGFAHVQAAMAFKDS